MTNPPADPPLLPLPDVGRRFSQVRTVRLSDADVGGYLRLDATARYGQDLANDDTVDGGFTDAAAMAWVVRKTTIERHQAAQLHESLTLTTWCSGVGSRWAERRTSMHGERGACVEMATVWVHVDPERGVPAKLPAAFDDVFAAAAQGRKIRARLQHDSGVPATAEVGNWPLRVADLDVLGHVNNAATWAIAEEFGLLRLHGGQPVRAEIEYRAAIPGFSTPQVCVQRDDDAIRLWVRVGDDLCTTMILRGLASPSLEPPAA